MSIPAIPNRLKDWNIQVIDNLLPILSIESETFDFKGHDFNKELYCDLCAMANTSGGYIVLGIDENQSKMMMGPSMGMMQYGMTKGPGMMMGHP
jgi:predicted HTH transcriptional regulator